MKSTITLSQNSLNKIIRKLRNLFHDLHYKNQEMICYSTKYIRRKKQKLLQFKHRVNYKEKSRSQVDGALFLTAMEE